MVSLQALVRLTRIWNLLIIGLAQYGSAVFLIGYELAYDSRLFLLVLSTVLIAAGGYSINDYYDVKIDLINKPERVVVGKAFSRRTVLLLHTLFSAMGIGLGLVLNWKIGVINFMSVFLLWLYSNALKRLPFVGNVLVALLTALSILVVNMLFPPVAAIFWVYSLFAFFMTLVREIVKDVEDLKGDDTFGCRTLPIVWGIRPTKVFIYLLLLFFLAVVIVIHIRLTPMPLLFFIAFLFLPMGFLVVWIIRADTRKDFSRLSQFCKIIMLAGIFSMAFL